MCIITNCALYEFSFQLIKVHRPKHFNVLLKFYYDEVHERSNIVQHVVMNLYNIIIIASFLGPFLACSIERLVRMRLRQSKPQVAL